MSRAKRLTVALAALGLLAGACQSTGGGGGESAAENVEVEAAAAEGTSICFGFQALETEFWAAGHQAITEVLTEAGVEVIEHNSNEDPNRQLEQVRDCITQGVDGILIIPQDGESANTIIAEANAADIPIGIFNRPPATEDGNAIVAVADNEAIAQSTVEYLAQLAEELGRPVQPLIMVGDLGDPNAVARRQGFLNVIEANPDLFLEPVEVATEWDADTGLANLQSAMQANPDVDVIFTSSDFLFPQIQAVLEPLGRWVPAGEEGHVILGGLDGDSTACALMEEGYVDATGVQDLFFEAESVLNALLEAIESGETQPDETIPDPGFAYTQENAEERREDMWGCVIEPPA